MNSSEVIKIIYNMSEKIEEKKEYLNEIDNYNDEHIYGDNISSAFKLINSEISDMEDYDVGKVLGKTGRIFMSVCENDIGKTYGSAFIAGGAEVDGKFDICASDARNIFGAMIESIWNSKGKKTNEKLVLYAMIPAFKEYEKKYDENYFFAIRNAVYRAYEGAEYTKTVSIKECIKENRLCYPNVYAMSFAYILESVYDYLNA